MAGYKQIAHLLPEILETADKAGGMREEVLRALIDHALANVGVSNSAPIAATETVEKETKKQKKRGPKAKAVKASKEETQKEKNGRKPKEEKEEKKKKKRKSNDVKLERNAGEASPIIEIGELPFENVGEFMGKYQVSPDALKKLYGYTEQGIVGKYVELKTSKKSEAQVNATLLRTVANALANGSFSASIDEIKQEFKEFGILDTNIKVNLERRQNLFSVFDLKERIELSEDGKQVVAELIKSYE
ncbi:MAG: hypothetical protein SNJ55_06825 [Chloroherpetonaceae bacterium]